MQNNQPGRQLEGSNRQSRPDRFKHAIRIADVKNAAHAHIQQTTFSDLDSARTITVHVGKNLSQRAILKNQLAAPPCSFRFHIDGLNLAKPFIVIGDIFPGIDDGIEVIRSYDGNSTLFDGYGHGAGPFVNDEARSQGSSTAIGNQNGEGASGILGNIKKGTAAKKAYSTDRIGISQ